jgi:hypothetical protein
MTAEHPGRPDGAVVVGVGPGQKRPKRPKSTETSAFFRIGGPQSIAHLKSCRLGKKKSTAHPLGSRLGILKSAPQLLRTRVGRIKSTTHQVIARLGSRKSTAEQLFEGVFGVESAPRRVWTRLDDPRSASPAR